MSLQEELERRLKGTLVLVGVGSPLWGDDGAGPAFIHRLKGKFPAILIDAGEVPESYWGTIVGHGPQTILVIDAIDWGGTPGSVAILDRVQEEGFPLSTHRFSLNLLMDLLRKETAADVFVLGIQPGRVAFGSSMSLRIQETLALLEDVFSDLLVGGVRCC